MQSRSSTLGRRGLPEMLMIVLGSKSSTAIRDHPEFRELLEESEVDEDVEADQNR